MIVSLLAMVVIDTCPSVIAAVYSKDLEFGTAHAPAEMQDAYCGLYSLYGALSAVGKKVDFASLLDPKYIGSKQGSSVEELRQAAEDHAAHAEILTGLSAESLRAAKHPMILHVAGEGQLKEYNHWVLYLGMENGKARIIDAPDPVRLVSLADLLATWDGAALIVSGQPLKHGSLVAAEHAMILSYVLLSVGVLVMIYLVGTFRKRDMSKQQGFAVALKRSAAQAAVLLFAGTTMALSAHTLSQDGFLRNAAATSYVAAANMDTFFQKLSIDAAYRYTQRDNVLVIDARFKGDYQRGHLPEAISVPIDSSGVQRAAILSEVSKDRPILLYCQSKGCKFDDTMAIMLAREGFKDISLFSGGWSEWRKSEYHHE